jgi:hypothetical protein
LYLAKTLDYLKFKNFLKFKTQNLKIPTVNSGVEAAIHVAGVCCDPCGAMRWTLFLFC